MQNDLVWLKFRNTSHEPVWLDPATVGEAAQGLASAVAAVAHHVEGASVLMGDGFPMRSFLAAATQGSINFGFQIVIVTGGEDKHAWRRAAAEYGQIIGTVLGAFAFCGITLGNFIPEGPQSVDRNEVSISAGEQALTNQQVRTNLESFVRVALAAGADEVTISIPDQPDCRLALDDSHPLRLGSSGSNLGREFVGRREGQLVLQDAPIEIDAAGERRMMYVGRFEFALPPGPRRTKDTATLTVLVDWRSRRKPPRIESDPVTINGELIALDPTKYRATSAISAKHRDVQAILVVETMRIDE